MELKYRDIVYVMVKIWTPTKTKMKAVVREVKNDKVKVDILDSGNHYIKTDWFELSDILTK